VPGFKILKKESHWQKNLASTIQQHGLLSFQEILCLLIEFTKIILPGRLKLQFFNGAMQ